MRGLAQGDESRSTSLLTNEASSKHAPEVGVLRQRHVLRARIAPLAAGGVANEVTATQLECSKSSVLEVSLSSANPRRR